MKPDRVTLTLPMLSLLPEDSVERLQTRFGKRFEQLSSTEVQALVTADVEGAVTNPRLQEICNDHPADISRILQGLAMQGFLLQEGQRRWSSYRLPPEEDSSHKPRTPHTASGNSLHIAGDSSLSLEHLTEEQKNQLNMIAAPATTSSRLAPDETRRIIWLCAREFLSPLTNWGN
jgi:ATP-dependent DNA helicase RecG